MGSSRRWWLVALALLVAVLWSVVGGLQDRTIHAREPSLDVTEDGELQLPTGWQDFPGFREGDSLRTRIPEPRRGDRVTITLYESGTPVVELAERLPRPIVVDATHRVAELEGRDYQLTIEYADGSHYAATDWLGRDSLVLFTPAGFAWGVAARTFLPLATIIAVFAVLGWLRSVAVRRTRDDPAAATFRADALSSGLAALVARRWTARTRPYRTAAGAIGVAGALGAAMPKATVTLEVDVIATCWIGGVMIGAWASELHLTRTAPESQATANLQPRILRNYLTTIDRSAIAIAAVAATSAIGLRVAAGVDTSVPLAVGALVVLAATTQIQRRIVTRRRPAVHEVVQAADDWIRHIAVTRGMAPAVATALLLSAFSFDSTEASTLYSVIAIVLMVGGFVWYGTGSVAWIKRFGR